MALDLLNVENLKVHNVLMAALSLILDAWPQMVMGTLKKEARNQCILTSRAMLQSFALIVALRRRSTPGLAVNSFYQLSKGMPQCDMKQARKNFAALLRPPGYVAGLGTIIQSI